FDVEGGEKKVAVSTAYRWTATSSASWLTLTPSSGNGGSSSKEITVTAEENKTVSVANRRTAKITISTIDAPQNVTREVTVEQKEPAVAMTCSPTTASFTHVGGATIVRVTSNVNWAVSVPDLDKDWVALSTESGSQDGTFIISVAPSSLNISRGSRVTLKGGSNLTAYITITQSAVTAGPDSVTLSSKRLWVRPGETKQLTATVYPSNILNKDVIWASDDVTKATVAGGWVVGIAEGKTIIRVITVDGGKTAACAVDISITDASEEVEAAPPRVSVGAGRLTVSSPAAEQVSFYTVGGALLLQVQKAADAATFDVSRLPKGTLIVTGSSGWAEKVIVP
ncbi:MAG: Ig-like domain-containing protein, partial [Tannerella sp.]|nr:Ig-like domain-containing protein [Tannerella sp.]